MSRYYDINSHTLDDYFHEHDDNGNIKKPRLLIDYLDYEEAANKGYEQEYFLTPTDLGPFTHLNPKNYLNSVKKFELKIVLSQHLDSELDLASDCYQWGIDQQYDFSEHGPINVILDIRRSSCSNDNYDPMKRYVWIGFAVLILSVCSLCSIFLYF